MDPDGITGWMQSSDWPVPHPEYNVRYRSHVRRFRLKLGAIIE